MHALAHGVRLFINTYVSDTFKRFKPLRYIALIAGVTVLILRCRKDNFNYTTVLTTEKFLSVTVAKLTRFRNVLIFGPRNGDVK